MARTRTQELVEEILKYIDKNRLTPGAMLPTEAKLMSRLHTSRNILREAIAYLKGLGVLESRRGSGFRVAKIDPLAVFDMLMHVIPLSSPVDLDEIFRLRITLELGSIRTAVQQATPGQVERIIESSRRMDALVENGEFTIRSHNHLETDFHCAIMESSGCRLLNTIHYVIRFLFEHQRTRETESDFRLTIQQACHDHRLIAEAFRARQPDAALAALTQHFDSVQNHWPRYANTGGEKESLTTDGRACGPSSVIE